MLILTIRTDKPEAELGLFDDKNRLKYEVWTAHKQLSSTVHLKIAALLESSGHELHDIGGIVVFKGPGSFTGLRIGITLANTLAYALKIPIVGEVHENWIDQGIPRLAGGESDEQVEPEYGQEPHITTPRK